MTPIPSAVLPPSPAFVGLLVAATAVSVLLYAERPGVRRRTVVSFVPWMVVGSALTVLATVVAYPAPVRSLVAGAGGYLTTYVVGAGVWFLFVALSTARGSRASDEYLGAAGTGAAAVLVGIVVVHGGASLTGLSWLVLAPVAAGFGVVAVLVVLALWYVEALSYTGVVGALAVFGQTLDGLVRVLGVGLLEAGGHSPASWRVLEAVATAQSAGLVGGDTVLVWAWAFLWLKLTGATVAVLLLTPVARDRPTLGYLLLGLIAAAGVTSGTTGLLSMVVGGMT